MKTESTESPKSGSVLRGVAGAAGLLLVMWFLVNAAAKGNAQPAAALAQKSPLNFEVCARWKGPSDHIQCNKYFVESRIPVEMAGWDIEMASVARENLVSITMSDGAPPAEHAAHTVGRYEVSSTATTGGGKPGFRDNLPAGEPISAVFQFNEVAVRLHRIKEPVLPNGA